MRVLVIFLFVLGAVAFMASCGSEVTEVAWTNSNGSSGEVKDILWAEGDAVWSETVARADTSSAKEVTKTVGKVECLVANGDGGAFTADVVEAKVNGSTSAFALQEGSSQTITMEAIYQ